MTGRIRGRSRRFEEWLFQHKVIFPLFLLVSIVCFMIGAAGMPYAVRSISRPLICGQPETVTGTIEAKSVRDVKAVFWIKGVKHKNTKTKAYFLIDGQVLRVPVTIYYLYEEGDSYTYYHYQSQGGKSYLHYEKYKMSAGIPYLLLLAAGLTAIVWLIWGTGRKAPEDEDRAGELHGKKKDSKFVLVFFTIVMFFAFLYFGYMGYWRLDEILF